MMTVLDIGDMLDLLESNYGQIFYDGVDRSNVIKTWAVMFKNDDPVLVMKGVMNCINTMSFKPTIADIRKRMAKSLLKGQMTPTEAFQKIAKAIDDIYDKESAIKAYNELPPILRRVVGTPSILVSWSRVSDEAFHTVIMSAIRESYKELAQQELDYNALPEQIKVGEGWMVDAPKQESLPEPVKELTLDEMESERVQKEIEYRERYGMQPGAGYSSRVEDFKKPLTKEDIERMEQRLTRKFEQLK